MRRPLWLRLVLGLWAVWFNAALLEAPGVHTCPVHSPAHSHGVGIAPLAHAMGTMDAPSAASGHQHADPHQSHDPACQCLGLCCGATPAPAPRASLTIVAQYTVASPARIGRFVAPPALERAHERPFANGPPSLA